MPLHKLAILLSLLIALLISAWPANAQPQLAPKFPPTPLLVGIRNNRAYEGDIWALQGTVMVQRTTYGHSLQPVVSPLGDSFAFQQIPESYWKPHVAIANRLTPEDIYVMNLGTSQALTVATQPGNVSYDAGQGRYILRSQPAWSPDGKLLAWTEIATDQVAGKNSALQDESVVEYNVTAKTTRTVIPKLA